MRINSRISVGSGCSLRWTTYDFDNLAKGQSYTISDNSPVNIAGIESASGGKLVLRTDDGGTVDAGNVKFGDYGTARLYKVIADMGVNADIGNRILDAAKSSRLSASAYAIGVREAFDAGRSGVALDTLSRDSHAMRMDEETRKAAWEAGRESRNASVQQKQEAVDSGKHGVKRDGLTVEDSAGNITELNEQQKSGMDAAKLLAEMGLDVTVYASTEADRKAGMENGNIRLSDGSIRVDLNAGADGQGVMAFALSHEFTHFVEEMSPKKFRTFTDILFEEAAQKGTDVSALIEAKAQTLGKMEENKGLGENALNDLAYSEVTAEMMETALTDTDVMERISARLQQTDKSLWGKIKDFLKGLVDRLKAAYKGMNPDSSIARLARETINSSERVLDAFADAASDAVVNYRLQDGSTQTNMPNGTEAAQNVQGLQEKGHPKTRSRDGMFTINKDGSVEFTDGLPKDADTLKGFRAKGMLKFFDVEINGQILDITDGMPVEKFRVQNVKKSPVVKWDGGSYSVAEKGILVLQDGQKNNAPEGVQYSLREYTEQQKKNWENSKRIVVYNNQQQLTQFISDSIADKTMDKKMYFGAIPSDLAARINSDTGVDVEGYNLSLGSYEVRKILKDHGNAAKEATRGQRAIVADDFGHITDIVLNPTKITLSEQDYMGKPAIIFSGDHNGKMNVVAVVSDKRLDLFVQTVYTNVKKGNLATPTGEQAPINTPEANGSTVSGNSIRNSSEEVKGILKSSRNIQQTKNLVALHNLTEDKFLKTLELGGFPMPSIAVTKADIPHTNFGDITVVFGKETIDPKGNRKNAVYSADAWTPTVPQVEYEADSKTARSIQKKYYEIAERKGYDFVQPMYSIANTLSDELTRHGGAEAIIRRLESDTGMMNVFLEDTGVGAVDDIITRTVISMDADITREYDAIVNALGADAFNDMQRRAGEDGSAAWRRWYQTYGEQMKQASAEYLKRKYGFTNGEEEKLLANKTALSMKNTVTGIRRYLKNGGDIVSESVDTNATKQAIRDKVDPNKYSQWLHELLDKSEGQRGVHNGKDYFDRNGNLKSFKQTHLPATLEGIVQAMTAQNNGDSKNVSGFYGVKTLRAGTAERFSSIAAMHEAEGRLQNLTEAEQAQIYENLSDRLWHIIQTIDAENGGEDGARGSSLSGDHIGNIMMEIADSRKYNVSDIQQGFQQYGKEISDVTAARVKELLFDISQMPVNIFEAKPARAVGFDEIRMVLVPDTASHKLLGELDSRGIPYRTYEAGNEELRQQMVQDMEDIRFSSRQRADGKAEQLATEVEYLKKLVQIQKKGNSDYTLDRTSLRQFASQLIRENGASGSSTELAALLEDTYNYISRSTDFLWEGIEERAGKAVDWLEAHRKVQRDSYAQEVLDFMSKRHVKLSEAQLGEVQYQYGSLKEFRSAIRGSIVLDQNANTTLDQFWQEGAAHSIKEPLNKSSAAEQRIFSPTLRYPKWEIHPVFHHFEYLNWSKKSLAVSSC